MDNIFTLNVDNEGWHSFDSTIKLKNGQTAKISFQETIYVNKFTEYNVCFVISTKKKHMEKVLDNPTITGKAGMEGLIWAKNKILEFEEFIVTKYPKERIIVKVHWADNRRRDVYTKALSKYGYRTEHRFGFKSLYKELKNVG